MSIEIKTTSLDPIRHTFSNVARRLGSDKTASRYQEATFDLQPTVNFHYRPTWDRDHALFDKGRTQIKMEDWYLFRDPRQFYYGTWVITRSQQQAIADRNFSFVESRNLLDTVAEEGQKLAALLLVPLRHVEYGANLNNCYIAAYGYGTAITQAASFNAIDRLGIAQYLSRLGLLLDQNTGAVLSQAKEDWLTAEYWQPLRELMEELLVTRDWFELYVAQNVVLDGLLYPLIYQRFDMELAQYAGSTFSMLFEFQNDWYTEVSRWTDATIRIAASESDSNHNQIIAWVHDWMKRCTAALNPLAIEAFGAEKADIVIKELCGVLSERLSSNANVTL